MEPFSKGFALQNCFSNNLKRVLLTLFVVSTENSKNPYNADFLVYQDT